MKKILLIVFVLNFMNSFAQQKRSYKIIAYYTGNGETIQQYPVKDLTHIIYSFLALKNDGIAFRNDRQKQMVEQLVQLKKQFPGLKIMVSIGGWGGCAPCSELFSSAEHRDNFAKSTVAFF